MRFEIIRFASTPLSVQAWVYTNEGPILGPVGPLGVVLRPSDEGGDLALEVIFLFEIEKSMLGGHREVTFDAVEIQIIDHVAHKDIGPTRLAVRDVLQVAYALHASFDARVAPTDALRLRA